MMSAEFYAWLSVFALLCLAPVLRDARAGRLDFLNPRNLFVAFYFLYYGLRTLDLHLAENPLTFHDLGAGEAKRDELTAALGLSVLGLLFFYLGYYGRAVVALERVLPTFRGLAWNPVRAKDVTYLLLLAGAGAGLWLIHLGGGFLYYLENINYVRLFVLTDVGYLKFLVNLLALAVLVAGIDHYFHRDRERPVFLYLLAALSVLLNLVVAHRWAAMQTVLYLLILRHYWRERIPARHLAVVVAALIVFNVLYGSYRSSTEEAESRVLEAGLESVVRADEDAPGYLGLFLGNIWIHFHGTDSLLYTRSLMRSEGVGHHYGWYILQDVLLVSVPRSLWPGKPNPSHVRFNQLLRGESPDHYDPEEKAGGVVQTILGELYWAGGPAGIALGMYLAGLLCGVLYLYLLNHRRNPFAAILYAVGLVQVVTLNGSLSVTLAKLAYLLVVVAAVEAWLIVNVSPGMVTRESA